MIIVKVEGKINVEKALKILKSKFNRIKTMKELRDRKEFKKKSVKKREELKKAIYIQHKFGDNNDE